MCNRLLLSLVETSAVGHHIDAEGIFRNSKIIVNISFSTGRLEVVEWLGHLSTRRFYFNPLANATFSFGKSIIIQLATLQAKMLINSVH